MGSHHFQGYFSATFTKRYLSKIVTYYAHENAFLNCVTRPKVDMI